MIPQLFFYPRKTLISFAHVKNAQKLDWKNSALDPKKRFATPGTDSTR